MWSLSFCELFFFHLKIIVLRTWMLSLAWLVCGDPKLQENVVFFYLPYKHWPPPHRVAKAFSRGGQPPPQSSWPPLSFLLRICNPTDTFFLNDKIFITELYLFNKQIWKFLNLPMYACEHCRILQVSDSACC